MFGRIPKNPDRHSQCSRAVHGLSMNGCLVALVTAHQPGWHHTLHIERVNILQWASSLFDSTAVPGWHEHGLGGRLMLALSCTRETVHPASFLCLSEIAT